MIPQINGVEVAIVVDINDESGRHRVKLKIPSHSESSTLWARVALAPTGRQFGWDGLRVNDEVVVAFESGDVRRPIVIGVFWNEAPPSVEQSPGSVQLPTGAVLRGFCEPGDVAGIENLLQQLPPYLAAMECQNKMLAILKPLIEIVKQLPSSSPSSLANFVSSAQTLAPCFFALTPASIIPFNRDLLCVTMRSLQSLRDAPISQTERTTKVAAIQNVLDLAEPYFSIAGIPPVTLPRAGTEAELTEAIAALQTATETLGGCRS